MTTFHILKIYSEYAEKIYDGTKLYELRKDDKNIKNGDTVILLETMPNIKIRGGFLSGNTIKDSPVKIWDMYSNLLGISQEKYFDYYKDCDFAYATKIEQTFLTNLVTL